MLDNPDLNIKHELHMFKQIKTNGWLQYTRTRMERGRGNHREHNYLTQKIKHSSSPDISRMQ